MSFGKVWLIGAGPGDPGLLTQKGFAALRRAQVVVYDRLVGQGILALMPEEAEKIDVGKHAGNHPVSQDEINRILSKKASEGYSVARLKGGDPFVFGRGGEELRYLHAKGIECEVIPGVSSALAVPAYAGIPVTHRDTANAFHVFTAHGKYGVLPLDFSAIAALDGTLIFLMGVSALPLLCEKLLDAGMCPSTPAAVIEQGTTARQKVIRSVLSKLSEESARNNVSAPALIVVGETCGLGEMLHWRESLPLSSLRVIVTRMEEDNSRLASRLEELGAETVRLSLLERRELAETWLPDLAQFGWLVFLSAAGVRAFFAKLFRERLDVRKLSGLKCAAVGKATATALEERGIFPELVPAISGGESLGGELLTCCGREEKLLLIRAADSDQDIDAALREGGLCFTSLPLYETVQKRGTLSWLEAETADYVLFASSSAVNAFVKAVPCDFSKMRALCIGPKTAAAAKKAGMQVTVSREASTESMVQKLLELRGLQTSKDSEPGEHKTN